MAGLASSRVELTPVRLFSRKNLISALTRNGEEASGTMPSSPPGTFCGALESVMPLVAAKNLRECLPPVCAGTTLQDDRFFDRHFL